MSGELQNFAEFHGELYSISWSTSQPQNREIGCSVLISWWQHCSI